MIPAFSVLDIKHLFRFPGGEFEIVRDDPSALFQLLFQKRRYFVVSDGKQIGGDEVGGGVILLEQIAMNDARDSLKAQRKIGRASCRERVLRLV